jgi:hypothetical protein
MLKAGNGRVAEVLLAIGRRNLPRSLRDGHRQGDLVIFRCVLLDGGGFVDKARGFCLEVLAIRLSLLPMPLRQASGPAPPGCMGRGGR